MVKTNMNKADIATQHKVLTVYKASAGSGKTFTLATEYIKLLIENPYRHRSILAVTFTNKATEEMKMRILSQLYGIANGLQVSDSYLKQIKQTVELSDNQIRERAQKALSLLLHNYNHFRVETIDSFFQNVLRNLARELDLTANLKVELNDKQIEEKAVDELIEELRPNNKLLEWILDYIEQNISDDKAWNVIGQIKKFGANIFKDIYKAHIDALQKVLHQEGFFSRYTRQLRGIRQQAIDEFQKMGAAFDDLLQQHGATVDDLTRGKSGPAGYFIKLKQGIYDDATLLNQTAVKAMETPEAWLTKTKQKDEAAMALATKLQTLLAETDARRKRLLKPYKTADITLKHLNQLRLLNSIGTKVREMVDAANSFLLSDTQTLLHALIDDSDSPFIFEKIGTQLEHIMIDEFQDTSTIQWQNFKILLQECISRADSSNLIVGDVKQSIYRWRSGDWRLLNNIESEFASRQDLIEVRHLDTNYRSERNIVEFNNAFFTRAAQIEYEDLADSNPAEAEQLKKAYRDVCQNVPESKGRHGFVQIKLLPKKDYDDAMMNEIVETVSTLLSQGIRPKNIAILVRSNKTIQAIADMLMLAMPHVKLVSDEAFRLDASMAVNTLVDALHLLVHPDDQLVLANLAKTYQNSILNNNLSDNDLFVSGKDIRSWLPPAYINNREKLLTLPIFDLAERLYNIFGLGALQDQSAYVCAFYDLLAQYLKDNMADIDSFIDRWNETLHEKTIQSDGIDGIRLLTIHKSKGLEFDHVILPFCDWQLEKVYTLWCHPEEAPFNELPIIPIDFSEKQMKDSIFEKDYCHEHLQNVVDNLNLLYVALTRASKNLFVFGQRQRKGIRSKVIEDALEGIRDELEESRLDGDFDDKNATIAFEYGSLFVTAAKAEQASANVFLQPAEAEDIKIESFENAVEFKQSNRSRAFVEQQDNESDPQKEYIRIGNILHQLFSKIHTTADIESVLQQLEGQGILYDTAITRHSLHDMLAKRLNHPKVAEWFSDRWQLFNECSILHVHPITGQVMTHRPDRVMTDGREMIVVDFKFGSPRPEYREQIRQYMALLGRMGYAQVKGYLWFVYSNKIEEVK